MSVLPTIEEHCEGSSLLSKKTYLPSKFLFVYPHLILELLLNFKSVCHVDLITYMRSYFHMSRFMRCVI